MICFIPHWKLITTTIPRINDYFFWQPRLTMKHQTFQSSIFPQATADSTVIERKRIDQVRV